MSNILQDFYLNGKQICANFDKTDNILLLQMHFRGVKIKYYALVNWVGRPVQEYLYTIRQFPAKYRLIFLRILGVFSEPLFIMHFPISIHQLWCQKCLISNWKLVWPVWLWNLWNLFIKIILPIYYEWFLVFEIFTDGKKNYTRKICC